MGEQEHLQETLHDVVSQLNGLKCVLQVTNSALLLHVSGSYESQGAQRTADVLLCSQPVESWLPQVLLDRLVREDVVHYT